MPELPEVETIVRDLTKHLPGLAFSQVIVHDPFVLRQKSAEFIRRLNGKSIVKIHRRGKAIIIYLSSGEFLIVQLMMTGQLVYNGIKEKHARISFVLSDGSKLLYNDQRKFGQLRVIKDLKEVPYFHILGPEPFSEDFTPEFMGKIFRGAKRPIKNALLDHRFVAGIGNIYACEILFFSKVSPKRQVGRLTKAEITLIRDVTRDILNQAIAHRGSSMRNYRDAAGEKGKFTQRLTVYGREGLSCPTCDQSIIRIVQAGRSTFYCGHCQK